MNPDLCKACGKCVAECPKHLIELVPADAVCVVQCSSKDRARNCPADAITIENNIAHIDQEKCTHCGVCKEKCPVKIISGVEE